MCGIIGYIGNEQADKVLLDGLEKLEYRGYDSAGIAVFDKEAIHIRKVKGRLNNLRQVVNEVPVKGMMGIGHTRWATHGEPSDQNSHPHYNVDESIAIVHNGIIENYLQLKSKLIKEGYIFRSETDTEVIAHLTDYYYRQGMEPLDAVYEMLKELKGSYAIGVMFRDLPGKLIATRKDSPLVIGLGEGQQYIASDIPAILKHTRDIYLLEDLEVAILEESQVMILDHNKNIIEKDILKVDWDMQSAEKEGYKHFMLKEIHQQPDVVRDTLIPRFQEGKIILDDIHLTKEHLENINKVYMVACGTAHYACLVGKYLLERVTKLNVSAETASEFRYREPVIDENTLVIVVSQSGETADTLAALRMAKTANARVIGIVNVVGSTMAREADDVLYTWAGPEIAVASTKAYSCQLAALYLLTLYIGDLKGIYTQEDFIKAKQTLLKLPSQIEEILGNGDYIKSLADTYKDAKNIFYIGRGLDYAVSMEGSLKLKEIAYIHSESYAAGELKHGPIALIEESTLVVGILTQDSIVEKTISNIKEVKARGAKVICIAYKDTPNLDDVADHVIYIPRTEWQFSTILANIPQQLFAYHIADALGHDVDKPRNLAKSVTVE